MVDPNVGHETTDIAGQSLGFQGAATANYNDTQLKANPLQVISEFLIENDKDSDDNLEVSIDGSTLFKTICPGGHLIWSPKGFIKIVYIRRAGGSSVNYEATVNFEEI